MPLLANMQCLEKNGLFLNLAVCQGSEMQDLRVERSFSHRLSGNMTWFQYPIL